MKDETNPDDPLPDPWRRELLKTATWAASVCVTGGALQLGCADSAPSSATSAKEGAGSDFGSWSAREVVERIRNGDVKAEEYAAHLLARHKAHRDLNAVITLDEARVLHDARAVDQARARGEQPGALAGLPFVIKDQIDVAGYPTTAGHRLLKAYVPKQNAAVVETLLQRGGIVLAKANCGPMVGAFPGRPLSAATNNNPYFGPSRNPYDPARISGGSSGGNGTAIGARLAPAGLGEDTGGSIRIPSAFCGIAGLRPSTFTMANVSAGTRRKRYPDTGIIPPPGLSETIGPMARTVADVAFIDEALMGEPIPQVNLRAVRIGIPRGDYWERRTFDPEVKKIIDAALSRLRDRGAQLVEVDLHAIERIGAGAPIPPRDNRLFEEMLAAHVPGVTMEALDRHLPFDVYTTATGLENVAGGQRNAARRGASVSAMASEYSGVFRDNTIVALAFPSQLMRAPLINPNGDMLGQKIPVNGTWVDELQLILSTTNWGARIGAPSLSVPAGLGAGLPVGLMLQGIPGADPQILGLGMAVEAVLGPVPPPLSLATS